MGKNVVKTMVRVNAAADLLLESLEADDEVGESVVRQRLPRFDVVQLRLSRTQAADVVVCR